MLYRDNNKVKHISIPDYVKSLQRKHVLTIVIVKGVEKLHVKPTPNIKNEKLIALFRDEILSVLRDKELQRKQKPITLEPVEPITPVEPVTLEPEPEETFSRDAYNLENFNMKPVSRKPYDPMDDVNVVAPWLVSQSQYKDEREFLPKLLHRQEEHSIELKRYFFAEALRKSRY